jgi:SAM-dependent methyltransferase
LVRNLFRLHPDPLDTANYSASHKKRGDDYHRRFSDLPARSLMWELEREALSRFIGVAKPSAVLDFATGTGRIAAYIKSVAPAAAVTGIDISESMLEQARANAPEVDFLHLDGRQALAKFGSNSVDLVTAFRFFPNAEFALRESVGEQLADLVKPGGWIIVNNHRNFWSPTYLLWRTRPRYGAKGALNSDIEKLLTRRGFEVAQCRSLGLWPQSDERAYGLPWSLAQRFERFNARSLAGAHKMGVNTLWLFRKHLA